MELMLAESLGDRQSLPGLRDAIGGARPGGGGPMAGVYALSGRLTHIWIALRVCMIGRS